MFIYENAQKTQEKLKKLRKTQKNSINSKNSRGPTICFITCSWSIEMRKIGANTDFSPKTHVFYMKTPKKLMKKLRKTKKTKKTQEGPTSVYLFHNLSPVTPTGHV